jgi:hypothetical protein
MKLANRISLHFVELKAVGFASVVIFILALGYVIFSSMSVPSGRETLLSGVVESVGLTQDSALQLAHSTALVKLSSGQFATVHVPRSEVVSVGQRVRVMEIHETTGSSFSIVVGESNAQ